ncbi:MAG TPA: hypothetical protein VHO66_08145 [Ruminiclostridium sp.]|nr:hypothetical protein [Ruminiclostridium sp.]
MRKEQQKEIATIKPRTITIELSDADVDRLCGKAGGVGMTASELIESFIGDLVDGTYSNGSDERDYAEQWFDRCGYDYYTANPTFLRWLIELGDVNEAISDWNDLLDFKSITEPNEDDKEWAESVVENLKIQFNGYKSDWVHCTDDTTLEAAMVEVMQWNEQRNRLKVNEAERIQIENKQLKAVISQFDPEFFNRKCRVCGCTWNHACQGGCHWVADNLCSRCFDHTEQ